MSHTQSNTATTLFSYPLIGNMNCTVSALQTDLDNNPDYFSLIVNITYKEHVLLTDIIRVLFEENMRYSGVSVGTRIIKAMEDNFNLDRYLNKIANSFNIPSLSSESDLPNPWQMRELSLETQYCELLDTM